MTFTDINEVNEESRHFISDRELEKKVDDRNMSLIMDYYSKIGTPDENNKILHNKIKTLKDY